MYSPKVSEHFIPAIYELSRLLRQPMTTLVNQAVDDFLKRHEEELQREHCSEEQE
jgi:hypothetical protein